MPKEAGGFRSPELELQATVRLEESVRNLQEQYMLLTTEMSPAPPNKTYAD